MEEEINPIFSTKSKCSITYRAKHNNLPTRQQLATIHIFILEK
ncbi:hypothetical protein A0O36_01655 [Piscirickettsiaceae bacterium NZ-RLO1]|nr:hypothetical protein A0O36_01655 [Piscirickettsiaceae bacterium NZ-RLO1]